MRTKIKWIVFPSVLFLLSTQPTSVQAQNSMPSEKLSTPAESDPMNRGTIRIKKPEVFQPVLVTPDRVMPDFYQPDFYCGGIRQMPFLITQKRNYYWSRRFPFIISTKRGFSCTAIRML